MDDVQSAITVDADGVPAAWSSPTFVARDAAEARAWMGWKARRSMPRMLAVLEDLAENADRSSVRRAAASDLLSYAGETNVQREEGKTERTAPVVIVLQNGADLEAEIARRRLGAG